MIFTDIFHFSSNCCWLELTARGFYFTGGDECIMLRQEEENTLSRRIQGRAWGGGGGNRRAKETEVYMCATSRDDSRRQMGPSLRGTGPSAPLRTTSLWTSPPFPAKWCYNESYMTFIDYNEVDSQVAGEPQVGGGRGGKRGFGRGWRSGPRARSQTSCLGLQPK